MSVVIAAARTERGRRQSNEDGHLVDTENQVFLVADGMGGHAAGEVASGTAVRRVHEAWTDISMRRRISAYAEHGDADHRRALLHAVREGVMSAHMDIVSQAQADEGKHGMGTTFTGLLVAGGEAFFAHAGDSRAYLIRDGHAIQLTEDHTVMARMLAAGMEDGAEVRKFDHVLTNALGVGDFTRVATFIVSLYSGDRLLLCSDGVHGQFEDKELAAILDTSRSPATAANKLVEQAIVGGHDNATAVVVKVVEAGETNLPPELRDSDDEALALCTLFSALSLRELLRAKRIATYRELKSGRDVAAIAMNDRVAYVVLDGEISGDYGKLRRGDVVYPEALIAGSPLPEFLGLAETPVRLLTIRRGDFLELCDEDPDLGVKLYAAVGKLVAR